MELFRITTSYFHFCSPHLSGRDFSLSWGLPFQNKQYNELQTIKIQDNEQIY